MSELDHGNHLLTLFTLYTRNALRYLAKKEKKGIKVHSSVGTTNCLYSSLLHRHLLVSAATGVRKVWYVIGKVTQELFTGFLPKFATCKVNNNANSLDISRQPKLKGHKSLVPLLGPCICSCRQYTLAEIKVHNQTWSDSWRHGGWLVRFWSKKHCWQWPVMPLI